MRTPVVIVAGQGDTDGVVNALLEQDGTLVVRHRFDGQVVKRSVIRYASHDRVALESVLELCHGCVSCTIRNDLLKLLRQMHQWKDVRRIVVHLAPWLEPEPVCWAINHVHVLLGPGFIDGPAARDVEIAAVITYLDSSHWLEQAMGDELLGDGRTVAQVAVGQAEFADILVADGVEPTTRAVLRRLSPRAIISHADDVGSGLDSLRANARRGRSDDPLGPLLEGQPPLEPDNEVGIVEYEASRPFHPERLHDAIDVLLSGVVRARGRIWLASNSTRVMCLESAGGGLRVSSGGKWLAAMTDSELLRADHQRRALAGLIWDGQHGDRHTSIVAVVCGARADELRSSLDDALLTDAEMANPLLWEAFADPFGDWHSEPCRESSRPELSAPNANNHGDDQ